MKTAKLTLGCLFFGLVGFFTRGIINNYTIVKDSSIVLKKADSTYIKPNNDSRYTFEEVRSFKKDQIFYCEYGYSLYEFKVASNDSDKNIIGCYMRSEMYGYKYSFLQFFTYNRIINKYND